VSEHGSFRALLWFVGPLRYVAWLVLSAGLFLAVVATAAAAPEKCVTADEDQPLQLEQAAKLKPGRAERDAVRERDGRDEAARQRPACTPTPVVPVVVVPTATPTPWPTGASDRFDRPDSPVLGRADSGQVWQEVGDWAICGLRACVVAPPDDGLYARVSTNLTGQRVTATVLPRPTGGTNQAAVLAQITPDWGRYLVYAGILPSGRVELWLLENFVWREVAAVDTPYTSAQARQLELRASPGSAVIYVDGARQLGPVALPQPPTDATYAGIYGETAGPPADYPKLDSFSVVRQR
jgi:hypothetical protein